MPPTSVDLATRWRELNAAIIVGSEAWHLHQSNASPQEIAAAVDKRLAELRTRLVQAVALASWAAEVSQARGLDRPVCPQDGDVRESRGPRGRQLTTPQGTTLRLRRRYAVCPTCQVGFFPLDEELGLLPGQLTPRLHESLVRLGTWLPLAQAAEALAFWSGVTGSEPTVRRMTEEAGAADEAVQTADVDAMEEELPPAPLGPRGPLLSVEGAMIPRLPHAWAEVKTFAMGAVGQPVRERAEGVVHPEELSSCARLTKAETFGRLALVETQQRGTETARTVWAGHDGAAWIQGVVDLHRPDAVRILDVPQALG